MNILIVDDEELCREGMSDVIRLKKPEVKVLTADNGLEALKKLRVEPVDCLFLDIRMPKMNGIDLLKQARQENIRPELTVIISGFDDFEYAKTAIQENVFDYLLKPVTPKRMMEIIEKVEARLQVQQKKRQEEIRLRKVVEKYKLLLQQQLFHDLIYGSYSAEKLLEEAEFVGIDLSGERYLCASLELEFASGESPLGRQIQMANVEEQLKQFADREIGCYIFRPYMESFCLLFIGKDKGSLNLTSLISRVETLLHTIEIDLEIKVHAGFGEPYSEIKEIGISHNESLRALRYRMLQDISVTSIHDLHTKHNLRPWIGYDQISTYFYNRDLESISQYIQIALKFALSGSDSFGIVHLVCNEIAGSFLRFMCENGVEISEFYLSEGCGLKVSQKLRQPDDYIRWLENLAKLTLERVEHYQFDRHTQVVHMIKKYVMENFHRAINNTMIAEYFDYSPNYLGQLFRIETGMSLNEYINKTRMEKAKEMLRNTAMKIIDVALNVGFNDNQYFYKVFKKNVGVTPKEYREFSRAFSNEE